MAHASPHLRLVDESCKSTPRADVIKRRPKRYSPDPKSPILWQCLLACGFLFLCAKAYDADLHAIDTPGTVRTGSGNNDRHHSDFLRFVSRVPRGAGYSNLTAVVTRNRRLHRFPSIVTHHSINQCHVPPPHYCRTFRRSNRSR